MEQEIEVIELNECTNTVDQMKLVLSATLREWQMALDLLEPIKREDYSTEEEYKRMCMIDQLESIKDVKSIKKNIFTGVLNYYHKFLHMRFELQESHKAEKQKYEKVIEGAKKDISMAGLTTAGLSIIVPSAFPYLMIFNVPRIGIGIYAIRKNKSRIEINMGIDEKIEEIHDPLFHLTSDLREDYFKAKEELEKLKIKVLRGEDVKEDLKAILDPKRISLPELKETITELKQKEKKLIKDIHNN